MTLQPIGKETQGKKNGTDDHPDKNQKTERD